MVVSSEPLTRHLHQTTSHQPSTHNLQPITINSKPRPQLDHQPRQSSKWRPHSPSPRSPTPTSGRKPPPRTSSTVRACPTSPLDSNDNISPSHSCSPSSHTSLHSPHLVIRLLLTSSRSSLQSPYHRPPLPLPLRNHLIHLRLHHPVRSGWHSPHPHLSLIPLPEMDQGRHRVLRL